jgi:hypothetical protein
MKKGAMPAKIVDFSDDPAGILAEKYCYEELWSSGAGLLSAQFLQECCVNRRRKTGRPSSIEQTRRLLQEYPKLGHRDQLSRNLREDDLPLNGQWLSDRGELHSRVLGKTEWRSDGSKVRFILRPSHLFF